MALTHNQRGALFMVISQIAFIINDTLTKIVAAHLGVGQIMAVRGLFASTIIVLLVWRLGHMRPMSLTLKPVILLRMLGDQGETIGPNAFIAVAERFGLIRELDRWVVETAIATQGASRLRNDPVSLTINLSARHFGSADMLELIRDATHRHRADPGAIVFEVTETAAVENFTAAREFIQALRNAGYRFSGVRV